MVADEINVNTTEHKILIQYEAIFNGFGVLHTIPEGFLMGFSDTENIA